MPDSYLTILDVAFREAAPILFLLAVDAFIVTMSQFFSSVLFGVERIDEKAKIPFKQLSRSNLFSVHFALYSLGDNIANGILRPDKLHT